MKDLLLCEWKGIILEEKMFYLIGIMIMQKKHNDLRETKPSYVCLLSFLLVRFLF